MNTSGFTPPHNLSNLRQLLAEIDSKQAPIRLGGQSRRVLNAMLNTPEQVALASITELAERHGVNASTLTRLAHRLGLSGFNGLQQLFRLELTGSPLHFYSEQASQLAREPGLADAGLPAKVGQQECSNITTMIDTLDPDDFSRAAELMARAVQVRIYGVRQFYALSYFLGYALGMIRPNVATLEAGRQGIADALSPLQTGDVLIVASCFPYTASVIRTAEIAQQHGIEVIALTDTADSPLHHIASCSFCVPNRSLFYSNAMAGFFVMGEALLSEVAARLGDTAIEALRRREELISELSPLT
ncbi:MurR/RpiR family transcriptional regulator [Marinobacterium sedimentorum]|uniref:MurR/RpiR family transcriptional regulator n=1 Tax=Marinobacterium sedimentorum TaxID=2927804 RepID=UPI0020C6EB6F|nr:MurR/RpiR family transcriptional regulator [Marinobacterium sedimentorum]MCP8687387.1 MurR/RpiR family transcriptional regulator [Marinobacterium sedimentorum]